MEASIPYGSQTLKFSCPDTAQWAELPEIPALSPEAALEQALAHPMGTPALDEILAGKQDLVIVFSDKTRKYPVSLIIDKLIPYIEKAGLADSDITLLCGAGAHTQNNIDSCRKIVGSRHSDRFNLALHDAFNQEEMTELGTTGFGTKVKVSRRVTECSALILTGTIVPHFYAGFSGGRKGVMPGCAAAETITANHSLNFYGTEKGRNPFARTCNLENNPVHLDMLESATKVKVDFIINTTGKAGGITTGIFCGDMQTAHKKGCEFYYENYKSRISKQYQLVIAAAGGAPKDGSLYQAHKALDNAFKAVRPGGTLILAAECPEDYGKEGFEDWLQRDSLEAMENDLRREYCVEGHTAYLYRMKSSQVRVVLVSELTTPPPGIELFPKIEDALYAVQPDALEDILIIPEADQFII